jgi:predicted dithiol-disulfide oxidoreductase (DUF899 family)
MVKIEKDYVFDGPNGKRSLKDLFEARPQTHRLSLHVRPTWDKGVPRLHGLGRRLG